MKLIFYPNDILLKKVKPLNFNEHNAKEVEAEMLMLMVKSKGVGLAANQVELDASVFTIMKSDGNKHAVFNPIIREASKESNLAVEGCLSFPALMALTSSNFLGTHILPSFLKDSDIRVNLDWCSPDSVTQVG